MASAIARRIQWLHPVEREVYRTWRLGGLDQGGLCQRCGAQTRRGDVVYVTRKRGSKWKDTMRFDIHRRCVPTADFTTAGLPARRAAR
jgi:hypothetical protein